MAVASAGPYAYVKALKANLAANKSISKTSRSAISIIFKK